MDNVIITIKYFLLVNKNPLLQLKKVAFTSKEKCYVWGFRDFISIWIKSCCLLNNLTPKPSVVPIDKNICVDIQMVLHKGQLFIKQYMKGKPVKWGSTFFLYRQSDIIYNMVLFQD